jgi:hypothetical protein
MSSVVAARLNAELSTWERKYECTATVLRRQVSHSSVRLCFPLDGVPEVDAHMFADVAALSCESWFVRLVVRKEHVQVHATRLAPNARSPSPPPQRPRSWTRPALTVAAWALALGLITAIAVAHGKTNSHLDQWEAWAHHTMERAHELLFIQNNASA